MNDSLDPILQQEEQRKLRIQLIWRLAIAVALVVGVLGILTWLEQEKELKPQMTVSAPRAIRTTPASAPIASATTAASTPATSTPASAPIAASAMQTAAPGAQLEASAPLTKPATPTATFPKPEPAPQPSATAFPHSAAMPISKPTAPVITQPTTPTRPTEPVRPVAPFKSAQPLAEPILPQPQKLAPQQAGTPTTHYPLPVVTPNGYTVQTGVFLHSANAEKMLKQVQGAGIPAYLETRVQIGPFSNKAEAEAAVKKLRQMGIEPVLKIN